MADKELIPFDSRRDISSFCYNPFDALLEVNPEIAAVAYANRDGILKPEVMPLIATFRECQRDEQIARMGGIVNLARIGANERMNEVINKTQYGITKLQEEGLTARVQIQEGEETDRTRIQCSAALDMTRLKYEANVRIVEDQMHTQRYISDNELRATYIEATAQRDAIIASERIRGMVRAKESENRLTIAIRKAEFEYLTRVKEAEEIRAIEYEKRSSELVRDYLTTQAKIYRHAIGFQIMGAKLKLGETKVTYDGLVKIINSLCGVLSSKDSKLATMHAETPMGMVRVNIELK